MNKNAVKKGFTLIEILIAVSVLAVTLTAMASRVVVTIRVNAANMNSLQAYYLAQQGVEGMRNLRDSNWMQNYSWNNGFECDELEMVKYYTIDEDDSVNALRIDFDMDALPDYVADAFGSSPDFPWDLAVTLTDSPSNILYKVSDEGGYVKFMHDSNGEETVFSRYIEVSYDDCDIESAEISAVVSWNERGSEKSLVLSTFLTNWNDE